MLANFFLITVLIFLILVLGTVFAHLTFLVPFVPTKRRVAERMVEAAKIKPGETVIDLGCGDGRLLFMAEKTAGARAIGYEIAPLVFALAKLRALFARSSAQIRLKSFFSADVSAANVIFCYLFPNVMAPLAEKFKRECRPGTRVISSTFHFPNLTLVKKIERDEKMGMPSIYVYEIF